MTKSLPTFNTVGEYVFNEYIFRYFRYYTPALQRRADEQREPDTTETILQYMYRVVWACIAEIEGPDGHIWIAKDIEYDWAMQSIPERVFAELCANIDEGSIPLGRNYQTAENGAPMETIWSAMGMTPLPSPE